MVVFISFLAAGAAFLLPAVTASPIRFTKRIAQTISDSTQPWVQACEAAGGGSQCNTISVTAFSTLLAAPGPCEQQDAADQMIDLAKTLNNDAKMIQLAQVFAQQPRNSPDSLSVLYCQQAPKNQELNGLFQCQFQGVNPTIFTGNVDVGQPGTIPLGHSSPLSPAGSCAANPSGGIADGSQLVSITQDPGVASSTSGSNNSASGQASGTPSSVSSTEAASSTSTPDDSDDSDDSDNSTAAPAPSGTNNSSSNSSFKLQNGLDAQKLNQQFTTLTADSTCTSGQNACIGNSFAQCVNGKFVTSGCGSTLMCVALPLVNSPGTSITCDTQADAEARIAASGATGGLTGQ